MNNSDVNEVKVAETKMEAVPDVKVTNFDSRVTNPEMLDAVAQLNFNNPLGAQYSLAQGTMQDDTVPEAEKDIMSFTGNRQPGIMSMKFMPTFGVITDPTDPVNTASNLLFTNTLLKLSTNVTDVDPPDQFMYLMAVDSLAINYNTGWKLYASLRSVSFDNKYNQRHLVETAGFDYEDFCVHGADLFFWMSKWAVDLTQFVLPKNISVVNRHLAMSSMIYKDARLKKAQYYNVTPAGVWKYDAAHGKLVWQPIGNATTKMKFTEFKDLMEDLIGSIAVDNGMLKIATLLRRIYPESELFKFKKLSQDIVLQPTYNEEKILEFHNMDILEYSSATNLEITQRTDSNLNWQLVFDPTFTSADVGVEMKRQIDQYEDRVNSALNLTAMKLKFTVTNIKYTKDSSGKPTATTFKLGTCGTEIITNASIRILKHNGAEALDLPLIQHPMMSAITYGSAPNELHVAGFARAGVSQLPATCAELASVIAASNFKGGPIIYPLFYSGLSKKLIPCGSLGDVNHTAIVEDHVLKKAHAGMIYDYLGLKANS